MISYKQFLEEGIKKIPFDKNPKIGWWLDNDPITFYHGTHIDNLEFIIKNGIKAPTEGYTKDWVSLALDPFTGRGYAAMSGVGGETAFRSAGKKVKTTPMNERIVFKIQLPKSLVLKKMAKGRGEMQSTLNRLKDKKEYENWTKSDVEYYALTEIRMPKKIDTKFIKGYATS